MKSIVTVTAFAATLISGAAMAASTTELKVTGVIKPPACTPSFSGGGTIDFGVIPAASLTSGRYTELPAKAIPFAISCDAPVKVALRATDNRSASAVAAATGFDAIFAYGLGTVAGKKVGAYMLGMAASSTTADGAPARLLFSTNGNQTWTISNGGGQMGKDRTLSWTTPSNTTPSAFKSIVGRIWVLAFLEKPENLPLSQDVPLDGSATLEVLYL